MRQKLLSEILWFVPAVAKLGGVRRIALLGSMTTEKKDPKDIDFLVEVDDEVSLEPLAKIGRKMKGHAQNIGRGADIFLADARGPISAGPVIGYVAAQAYDAPAMRCIVVGDTIFTMIWRPSLFQAKQLALR